MSSSTDHLPDAQIYLCGIPVSDKQFHVRSPLGLPTSYPTQCVSHVGASLLQGIHDPGIVGVWQGVALDSLKFHLGPPCPTLLRPVGGAPRVAPAQGGQPAAVFHPHGHPTPYA
jgi:hypothetical protein